MQHDARESRARAWVARGFSKLRLRVRAFSESARLSWETLREAWRAERDAPSRPRQTSREREFLPAAVELVETPASPLGRAVALLLALFFVLALLWASIGRIDVHATLRGRLVPVGQVKVIESLDPGAVHAIHVQNGDRVEPGQLLLELAPTDSTVDRARRTQDLMTARMEAARLEATLQAGQDVNAEVALDLLHIPDVDPGLVALQTAVLQRSVAAHRATLSRLDGELKRLEAQRDRVRASVTERTKLVSAAQERADMLEKLVELNNMPRARYLEMIQILQEERTELVTEEGQLKETLRQMEAVRRDANAEVAEFLRGTTVAWAEAQNRATALEQELLKAARRDDRNRLRAPVAGVVTHRSVHTIGEVVRGDQQLMVIVPSDGLLEAEALLLNKDKGFVAAGQSAKVKIEAFPFTRYGVVPATVLAVSGDAVEAEDIGLVYPVRVALSRQTLHVKGKEQALEPGMAVTVEVRTGERRIIQYLLTPLLRYRAEAIRER